MAKQLVFTEAVNSNPKDVTFEILGKLSGGDTDIVCIGNLSDEGKKKLTEFGAQKIYLLNAPHLAQYSPEGYALALKDLIAEGDYAHVFGGATAMGKDLFPRLAGLFEAGMASEVVDFSVKGDQFQGTRPLFAGKCLANVALQGPRPHCITVRPNVLGMPSKAPSAGSGTVEEKKATSVSLKAKIKEVVQGASKKVDLTEANIIVSGGRSLKSSENFKILEELAEVLGASVGASRAAVDSGYAPHSMQVGQTGKTVSPSLYIACGISGAIQHLAGMRTSKIIVAINIDPDAPIFKKADYGIVGDLFKIVPLLTKEFKALLKS